MDFGSLEGECYLLTKADRHKKHWLTLIGNELYCYKSKEDSNHLLMHSLAGTFIVELPEEKVSLPGSQQAMNVIWPLKLIFMP